MTNNILFELFEIKQKFLREVPHPKLIIKQIRRLEAKLSTVEPVELGFEELLNQDEERIELAVFLEDHIQSNLGLKHKISSAPTYDDLIAILVELYEHQIKLLNKLKSYLPENKSFSDDDLKMSTPFDPYGILKSIRAKNLKENEIKNYLCTLLNASESGTEILLESCLRANKIISNG